MEIKQRVCLTYDRDRQGVITRSGPEVSEIKFDDGKVSYHPNRFIAPVRVRIRERLQPSSNGEDTGFSHRK